MDQTLLPFIYDDGKTYATKGSKDGSCATGPSGLDKRQCTAQLTVFGDGVPRVRPTLIFRGKGLRIKEDERKQWDRHVNVTFQPNAWCDEEVMKDWIKTEWSNYFRNPPTPGSTGKILVADVHRAQQTTTVKTTSCQMSDDYDDDNDYELLEESEIDTDEECNDYVQQEVWDGEDVDKDVDEDVDNDYGDDGGDDNDDDEN